MTVLVEQALTFTFDAGCEVTKYDDWSFYRNQFQRTCGGARAVDFLCLDNPVGWMIEVKDYRANPRSKLLDLTEEVAAKVRDTLAGLAAASANANDAGEKAIARRALRSRKWKVVLHLEQPAKASRLRPKAIDPAALVLKLRQTLKAVDAHPKVVDQYGLHANMRWAVAG